MHFATKITMAGLLSLALAGCGSNQQPAPAESQAAAPTEAASAAPAAAATTASAEPADFAMCKTCHSVQPGVTLIGPSLAGVYGRKAGAVAGFAYTDGVKALGYSWDEEHLDKWLENPMKLVPGTKMAYPGEADAAKRKAIIAYLKTLK
ncbi:MAG TPA: c-type cytochrome [Novosphingobium sp.]|nr:c-type cytochrome [Novosphingobium sp.]